MTLTTSSKFLPVVAGYRMLSFTFLSGPMTINARAGRGRPAESISSGSSMPSMATSSLLSSAMMGNERNGSSFWMPSRWRMSPLHAMCESTGSQEMPINFTRRSAKFGTRVSHRPSSVVQTGVKSLGWLKRMVQGASGSQSRYSWKVKSPCVVVHGKFGISAPSLTRHWAGASALASTTATSSVTAAADAVDSRGCAWEVRVTTLGEAAMTVAPAITELPGMTYPTCCPRVDGTGTGARDVQVVMAGAAPEMAGVAAA
mmetsp:Transcript_29931/g.67918  ORF Transcript_29931/g.67918 Transcript_29931/m.67918 type:complete len:258 (-) Transcript_29931:322-1095(-)